MQKRETSRTQRLLMLYTRLLKGEVVRKSEEAERYMVHERTIQRDLEDIRAFLDAEYREGSGTTLIYDHAEKGYRLKQICRRR